MFLNVPYLGNAELCDTEHVWANVLVGVSFGKQPWYIIPLVPQFENETKKRD